MSRKFQCRMVPSSWLELEERRLVAKPYFSGAIEAKLALQKLDCENLVDLTKSGKKGIFNGPRFSRVFVSDPKHGLKLISGSDLLQCDLSHTDMIAKWQARSMKEMILTPGTTLISSYGTIGRCVYTREDMAGHIGSDNVLKVIPDESKILPGYLYTFLTSKFGVPMIIKGEGGSVVTYLDPNRVHSIPVPRLGNIEKQAHDLIQLAANYRVEGIKAFEEAKLAFDERLGVQDDDKPLCGLSFSTIKSSALLKRVDAAYHSPSAIRIEGNIRELDFTSVGKLATVMLPPISSRVMTDDPDYGYSYFSGEALYYWTPEPKGYLARKSPKIETLLVDDEGILVQAFGQTYGLICRPTWIIPSLVGSAISGLMLRLTSPDKRMLRYLYAFIASRAGQIVTKRLPYGGSIPHMNEGQYREVPVPLFEDSLIDRISEKIQIFINSKTESNALEEQARTLVERTIEEGGR